MKKRFNLKWLAQPENRGKHLFFVEGKLFRAKNGKEAKRILARIREEYPKKRVTLTYVPKADTLILFV